MEVTRTLARFLVGHEMGGLPPAVRHEAARALLNWVGCAVGACRHETIERALAALAEVSGPSVATVLGRLERLDPLSAALLNGTSSHLFDFDDTHPATLIHPSAPIAPAALAAAEWKGATGAEFLHAFVLGVEAECRIGRAIHPAHYDAGWHVTATAGAFGAAAAAGRLLGLDEQRMVWALGIAATQAAGLREMFGTMTKPLHAGLAARAGLLAALLAGRGFTSAEQPIEGRRGFAAVLARESDLARITERLGDTWEIAGNSYKPYACGLVVHPAIDGCLALREAHGIAPEEVESVELAVHPRVLELTGKRAPASGLEAKFSVYHAAAVALVCGAAGEAQFSDAMARDPLIVRLRERVRAAPLPALRPEEARVAIGLRGGRRIETHVAHALGSLARPMSDAQLEAKARALLEPILSPSGAGRLIGLCWAVEALAQAAEIARASVPRSARCAAPS